MAGDSFWRRQITEFHATNVIDANLGCIDIIRLIKMAAKIDQTAQCICDAVQILELAVLKTKSFEPAVAAPLRKCPFSISASSIEPVFSAEGFRCLHKTNRRLNIICPRPIP